MSMMFQLNLKIVVLQMLIKNMKYQKFIETKKIIGMKLIKK